MKVQVEELSPVRKKVSVEIPSDTVTKELNKAYNLIKRQAQVKGFRKGKAPVAILKRLYHERVDAEVAQDLIQDSVADALKESNVEPVSQPDIEKDELREGQPFTYHVYTDVGPDIELKEYKGLSLEKPLLTVTDQDLDRQLDMALQAHVRYDPVEPKRPPAKDDVVVIDYLAYEGGEPIVGVEGTDFHILAGASYFSEGFDEALLGMEEGESKEIVTDFDDAYPNPLLRDKKGVSFSVTLKALKEKVLPELNDEFARSLGDFRDLGELRAKVREDMEAQAKSQAEEQLKRDAGDKLLAGHEFEVPESLVEEEATRLMESFYMSMSRQGVDVKSAGFDENVLRERYRDDALRNVKLSFLLHAMAEAEGLEVEEEELEEKLMETSRQMGPSFKLDDPEKRSRLESFLRDSLLEQKAFDFVIEGAQVEEVPPAPPNDKGEE